VTDWLLLDSARRLLGDLCTYEAVQEAESAGWSEPIWDALERGGYADLTSVELEDAIAVLRLAGEHAAPVPLAEAILAGWLLGAVPDGPVTVASDGGELRLDGGAVTGVLRRIPWGRAARRVVVVIDDQVVVVPTAGAAVKRQTNLAGEPRDALTFDRAQPDEVRPQDKPLRELGALTRAAMMSGALTAMARLTIVYADQRQQFGRPIGRFQAVQQHLVSIAQDASIVAIAVEGAARAAGRGPAGFEIAAAKALASQAALSATRAAHQVHGAMGMTQEYRLHHFSRRLWAWRAEYGNEQHWSRRLGQAVVEAGADQLYPLITGGSAIIQSP
jgi:acyl-CoA dehydrogenase